MEHLHLLLGVGAISSMVQAVTGFGGNLFAISLGVHLVPLRFMVLAVILLGPVQTAPIVWIDRKQIDRTFLLRKLLPSVTLGLLVGLFLAPRIPTQNLRLGFGLFVVLFALREGVRAIRDSAPPPPLPQWAESLLLLAGGIVHGLVATGGPLIVLALSRRASDRHVFRATLAALWLILNSLYIGVELSRGPDLQTLGQVALWLLPGLLLGLTLGQWLHQRVSPRLFRIAVALLLVGAGASSLQP